MKLTIPEVATRLGKTPRQVRTMVDKGKLRAQNVGGRWLIDADDLELSDGQVQANARKERQLRRAVEDGLSLPEKPKRRYSVRDLKAFQPTESPPPWSRFLAVDEPADMVADIWPSRR